MRFALFLALLGATPVSLAQDQTVPGFALSPAASPASGALTLSTTLADGTFVLFDGTDVVHHAADGAPLLTLGTLPGMVFPSFVVADPTTPDVYVGENSTGAIYRIALGTSAAPEILTTLAFNYDAAAQEGRLYVSAATCGFGCGSEIWRVDLATGAATLFALTPGASGPLTLSPAGDLYYGSVSSSFPPPPGSASVWRFTRAQLLSGAVLDLDDAQRIGSGYEGAARLAFDRHLGAPYLVETDFASGVNRIRIALGDASVAPVLVEARAFHGIGSLSFHKAAGPARFRAYQPDSSGALVYSITDFSSSPERIALRPERPAATLSLAAPGQVELRLSGGPSNGVARILLGPRQLVPPRERVFVLAGLPIYLGLDASTQIALGFVALDANGGFSQITPVSHTAAAELAVQVLLWDDSLRPVGTSSVAVL